MCKMLKTVFCNFCVTFQEEFIGCIRQTHVNTAGAEISFPRSKISLLLTLTHLQDHQPRRDLQTSCQLFLGGFHIPNFTF